MLYFNFQNYEEFKVLFGIVEHGNGVKSRRNKILLALYKDRDAFKHLVACKKVAGLVQMNSHARRRYMDTDYTDNKHNKRKNHTKWSRIYGKIAGMLDSVDIKLRMECPASFTSLDTLKPALRKIMTNYSLYDDYPYCVDLMEFSFWSDKYKTDDMVGLCEDGTINAIRYKNVEKNRVFRMRAGKMFEHLWGYNPVTKMLPEQIMRWAAEEFVADWIDYARENIGSSDYELHVDDNFSDIYDSSCCAGYDEDSDAFRSCMVDDGQWTFYRDAVDAKAAYLTDKNDMIVARCIIYTNVHEEGSDKIWRLAERQYSKSCEYGLQRQLVSALIRDGHIDGYKAIGSSCSDSERFVTNDGTSLSDKTFYIPCHLEDGDTLSYQDSFKWYDHEEGYAYNTEMDDTTDLATTSGSVTINEHRVWSDYHDEYISEEDAVYVDTREDYFFSDECVTARVYDDYRGVYDVGTCFEDDCIEIDSTYYYAGRGAGDPESYGIYCCPECGEYFVSEDSYYSELTEEDYCCEDCCEKAERKYHKDNGEVYSEYDEEWYDEDDVISVLEYTETLYSRYFKSTTISIDTFNSLVEDGEATEYCGKYYIDALNFDGEPAHLGMASQVA